MDVLDALIRFVRCGGTAAIFTVPGSVVEAAVASPRLVLCKTISGALPVNRNYAPGIDRSTATVSSFLHLSRGGFCERTTITCITIFVEDRAFPDTALTFSNVMFETDWQCLVVLGNVLNAGSVKGIFGLLHTVHIIGLCIWCDCVRMQLGPLNMASRYPRRAARIGTQIHICIFQTSIGIADITAMIVNEIRTRDSVEQVCTIYWLLRIDRDVEITSFHWVQV